MTGRKILLARNTACPGFSPFPHKHPHGQTLTIFSGTADVTAGGQTLRTGAGNRVCVPATSAWSATSR